MKAAQSPHSVYGTVERLLRALDRHGVPLLARIDHGAAAAAAGLELGGEVVLIFGDAKVGTLLMQSDPRVGYELPLRLLIWDAEGQTMVGFQAPTRLSDTYGVAAQAPVLDRMETLLDALVGEGIAVT